MHYLDYAAERCMLYSRRHIVVYGIIGVLSPIITIIDSHIAQSNFNTLGIRVATAVLCLPALFINRLPTSVEKIFHRYFVSVTAIIFPFGFGLMLALNAALSPPNTEIHTQWIIQYFIALFIFIQVIPNGPLATVLWAVSTIAATSPLLFLDSPNLAEIHRILVYLIPAYLTAVGLGILTNRQSDILDAEKLKAASAIGANLAHELRTPLASIGALSGGVERLLPTIVDGYAKAKEAGLVDVPLRKTQVETLRGALVSIQNEVGYSNTIIDMLLVNTADKTRGEPDLESLSAEACIREAVGRYPFNNTTERSLIRIHVDKDFTINAPRLLIVHVLLNLIKNALQYVQRSENASVDISTEATDTERKIIIHDNGPGIPAHDLPHIFDRFFTTNRTGQGSGIGLSFCKMVMDSIGGEITCDTVEGEYTTFTLSFHNV